MSLFYAQNLLAVLRIFQPTRPNPDNTNPSKRSGAPVLGVLVATGVGVGVGVGVSEHTY